MKQARSNPVDDAGRPTRNILFHELKETQTDRGDIANELASELKQAIKGDSISSRSSKIALFLGCVGFFGIYALISWLLGPSSPFMKFGDPLYLILVLLVLGLVTGWFHKRLRCQSIACTITAHGFCGGCGYDLMHQIPKDGLVTCPECGAEWNTARFTRASEGKNSWPLLASKWNRMATSASLGVDDRGMLFRAITSVVSRAPKASVARWSSEQLKAMKRARRSCGLIMRILMMAPVALIVVLLAVTQVNAKVSQSAPVWPALVLIIFVYTLVLFGVLAMVWRSSIGVRTKKFQRLCRSAGVCPCCAEPLEPARRDAEGLIVCRQCGTSWNDIAQSDAPDTSQS